MFEMGHPRNVPAVSEERFSKNCLKISISLPWQPELLTESNSVNIFKEDLPRNISAKFCPHWPSSFGGEDV